MWIEDYRRQKGMSVDALAARVRKLSREQAAGAPVEAGRIIRMLEACPGEVTHPRIADLIAKALGAPAELRDSIVPEAHRKGCPARGKREPKPRGACGAPPKTVVALDRDGRIVRHIKDTVTAARMYGVSTSYIRDRCLGKAALDFGALPVTFRYDGDSRPVNLAEAVPKGARICAIDREGRVRGTYIGARQAAAEWHVNKDYVYCRIQRRPFKDEFRLLDVTFRYEGEAL